MRRRNRRRPAHVRKTVALVLNRSTFALFDAQAERQGLTTGGYMANMLELIARDGLFEAILDTRKGAA